MPYEIVPLHQRFELLDECCELLNTEWKKSYGIRSHILRKSNDGLPCSLVMLEGGKVIGHVRLSGVVGEPKALFLTSVIIAPNLRGKGLGRKLLEMVEEFSLKMGFSSMCLSSEDKEIFYRKCGFEESKPMQQCVSNSLENTIFYLQNHEVNIEERNSKKSEIKVADATKLGHSNSNSFPIEHNSVPIPPPVPKPPSLPISKPSKNNLASKIWMRKYIK